MKKIYTIATLAVLSLNTLNANEALRADLEKNKKYTAKPKVSAREALKIHSEGSLKIARDQDEISADVQDLIQEQTNSKVLKLLTEIETLTAEAAGRLENKKTDGKTIAIETQIIEKMLETAKEKSK